MIVDSLLDNNLPCSADVFISYAKDVLTVWKPKSLRTIGP